MKHHVINIQDVVIVVYVKRIQMTQDQLDMLFKIREQKWDVGKHLEAL